MKYQLEYWKHSQWTRPIFINSVRISLIGGSWIIGRIHVTSLWARKLHISVTSDRIQRPPNISHGAYLSHDRYSLFNNPSFLRDHFCIALQQRLAI
jgi:hypothetical protein